LLRTCREVFIAHEDWANASAATGDLIDLLRQPAGRLFEALDLVNERETYIRRAGLGPWTLLSNQVLELQVLSFMGAHQRVLDQIPDLLIQMDKLSEQPASDESVHAVSIREAALDVGRNSAQNLGRWEQCLELNAAVLASRKARHVSDFDIATILLRDSEPLRGLGRLDEAEDLLAECQEIFENHGDIRRLAQVLMARANVQATRGNYTAAVTFGQTCIRYLYIQPEPNEIATAHINLAHYLKPSEPAASRAHLLAALFIAGSVGMADRVYSEIHQLVEAIENDEGQTRLPRTLNEVIAVAELTEGVRLGDLIAKLEPDRQNAETALAQVLDGAESLARASKTPSNRSTSSENPQSM
jgi:tetratricopeptide (TPR) repeat protein